VGDAPYFSPFEVPCSLSHHIVRSEKSAGRRASSDGCRLHEIVDIIDIISPVRRSTLPLGEQTCHVHDGRRILNRTGGIPREKDRETLGVVVLALRL
jgi:hypothetical protein